MQKDRKAALIMSELLATSVQRGWSDFGRNQLHAWEWEAARYVLDCILKYGDGQPLNEWTKRFLVLNKVGIRQGEHSVLDFDLHGSEMKGLFSQLTPEQQEKALNMTENANFGPEEFKLGN